MNDTPTTPTGQRFVTGMTGLIQYEDDVLPAESVPAIIAAIEAEASWQSATIATRKELSRALGKVLMYPIVGIDSLMTTREAADAILDALYEGVTR